MNIMNHMYSSKAKFLRYQEGVAYYAVAVPYSEMLYSFPVPLNDVNNEMLEAEGKTINFMEYIHKAILEGTFSKVIHQS